MRATQFLARGAIIAALVLLASPLAWGAVTGIISGTVTDKVTGSALAGANVHLLGGTRNVVSKADGGFVFTNVPPGQHTLSITLVGYAELQITKVVVIQDQEARLSAQLVPTVEEAEGSIDTVEAPHVTLHKDQIAPVYVTTAADERMTASQPNDQHQFPGLVFAQPGVVPDNTYYPHIRGARANQVGYFLEGIPITEPNANVFATHLVSIGLDRLELFTGSYPVEYGGFTGGVINQVVKRGSQLEGGLVDLGMGSPYDYGSLWFERGGTYGRADWYYGLSTWHSNFNDNLFTSSAPVVSDHIGKLVYDASEDNKITVLSHHGYARYLFPYTREFTFDPETATWGPVGPDSDYGRQQYDIDSIGLNHALGEQAYWNLRLSRVANFLELELGDTGNLFWQHRNQRMMIGQLDYQRQVGAHRYSAGLWQVNSDNNSRYSVFGTQYSPYGLLDSIANNNTRNSQAYLEDKWQLNRRLLLTLGARHDAMTYERPEAGDADLSETTARGGLTYEASPNLLLRGSVGTYVGFPRANLIAAHYVPHATENPDFADWGLTWDQAVFSSFPLAPQLDREREVGFDWRANANTLVTATVFTRKSSQVMQKWLGVEHDAEGNIIYGEDGNPIPSTDPADFDENGMVWYAANGTGTTHGIELKADRKLSGNSRAWLSYTYLDAKATSSADNLYPYGYGFLNQTDAASLSQEYPVDWNQKHTAVLAYSQKRGKLTVNPWMVYGSGFPYGQSGLDLGGSDPAHVPNPDYDASDPSSPEELVVPQNYVDPSDPSKGFVSPNSLKTGANFTVSLNFTYQIGPEREAYFQIYNLFDRSDVTSYVIYQPRTGGLIGDVQGDAVYYVPYSRTPPRFFGFGLRQKF